jgi:hypothetical protein
LQIPAKRRNRNRGEPDFEFLDEHWFMNMLSRRGRSGQKNR